MNESLTAVKFFVLEKFRKKQLATTFMNVPLTTVASGAAGGNSKQQSIMIVCTKEYTLVFGTPLLSLSKCKHFLRPGYIIGIV